MTSDRFSLEGKTVLVTGASSGIGRAIAIAAAAEGARLALAARNAERLEETRDACEGADHIIRSVDLTDLDQIPKFMRSIAKDMGPLAGMVHSAGAHRLAPVRAVRGAALQKLFTINAAAGVMLVKGMATKGCADLPASCVLLSSVMGRVGKNGTVAYAMSKGAVEQACKTLALELASDGVRVNCIAPAMIASPMSDHLLETVGDVKRQKIMDEHPMGLGTPEDVAGAAIYLLSDASRYVTGTSLLVDGGYCAQ